MTDSPGSLVHRQDLVNPFVQVMMLGVVAPGVVVVAIPFGAVALGRAPDRFAPDGQVLEDLRSPGSLGE